MAAILSSVANAQWTLQTGYPSGGTASGPGVFYWSNSGSQRSGSGAGPNSVSGPINFSWTYTGSPVPSYVVVTVAASATWGGTPNGGACTDGMSDPALPASGNPLTGQTSQGTHPFVLQPTGQTVTFSVTPTASLTGSGGLSVSAQASIGSVQINLTGPQPWGSNYDLMVGQELEASVSCPFSSQDDTYSWTLPGQAFGGYQVTEGSVGTSHATFSGSGSIALNRPTLLCYCVPLRRRPASRATTTVRSLISISV